MEEETIPENEKVINLTESSGNTLRKMGKYRLTVGVELLAMGFFCPPLRILGMYHIIKGTKSMIIGKNAADTADTKIIELSKKSTEQSVDEESKANSGLTELDNKITSVTGEKSAQENAQNKQEENEEGKTEEGTTEGTAESAAEGTAQGATNVGTANNTQENSNGKPTNKEEAMLSAYNKDRFVGDIMKNKENKTEQTGKTTSKSKKDKKEMNTDEAQDSVDDINASAKDDSKDSEKVTKDTEKDEKQLTKEAKNFKNK